MLSYARAGRRDEAQRVIETAIAPRGTPADVRRAWEALVKEGRRDVEERIGKGDLAGAIPLLEQLIAQSVQSPNPEQRAELTARLADVRQVLDYNRFVERYNRAMELAGRDPQAAIAILEDLVATTREPGQVEQAKKVLASLKAERRR